MSSLYWYHLLQLIAIATRGFKANVFTTTTARSNGNELLRQLVWEIEMEIEALQRKLIPEEKKTERIKKLVEDLRGGRKVTDFRFDQIYPSAIRKLSETHWTPVEVAIRAAELLVTSGKSRVLDVGAGCGKFCTVAALSSHGHFIGIEQRPHLSEVARKTAEELGANQASFIQGNMADLDWSFFDSFYLFNPFYENKMKSIRIDETVSHNQDKFNRYIEIVQTKLRVARPGTQVATYHGFGGDMPVGYHRMKREPIGTSYLELWVKLDLPKPVLKRTSERPSAVV
ncbi:methyltransferase domain-containing protein [Bdellovibrionota bacterium FG-1]